MIPPMQQYSRQVTKYLQRIGQGVLSKPQQRHLVMFVLALIVSNLRRTFTNQARFFGYDRDASCITRFLTEAPWEATRLLTNNQAQLSKMIARQPANEPIRLLIDDTATHKYGTKMESISRHYNDGKIRWGHCKITLFLCCGNLRAPYDSRLYVTKSTAAAEAWPFYTKLELARQMLEGFIAPKGRRVMVMFDSFYTSKKLLKYIHHERKWEFLARTESHRKVGWRGRRCAVTDLAAQQPVHSWVPLGLESHDYVGRKFRVGLWCEIPGSLVMACDPDDSKKVHYYITNRRDLSAASVVRLYQRRWYIETYHRDVKQLLGLAHYQLRSRLGLLRYWLLVDVAYCVLRLQTCWAAEKRTDDTAVLTLGQLRQQVQIEAEREKTRAIIKVWEETNDYEAAFKVAGCL
jgi:SRSO17 transposase